MYLKTCEREELVKGKKLLCCLALPDEHQLRFNKYIRQKELWEAILRTFGGNDATKKTKKNLLKQQYRNFKAEGSETLEQTFNILQALVSQLEFLDVPVEQEDLNEKFLTSLSSKWLMHTIVQKKGGTSSQNMAFISSSNTNSGKSGFPTAQSFPTASVHTASGQVTTASTDVATATFSHDTICAYIATQQSDCKRLTIQGSDVAGFDKSKVECYNCHKLGHFARECRAPRSQDRSKKESYKKEPKVEKPSHKEMMAIDGIGWDWSFMAEENEASKNQALVAEEVVPTEFALMEKFSSSSDNEVYDDSYCSKSCRKNTENLTTKINKLNEELFISESDLCNYKRGLSQVEARLVEFKINASKFYEKIRVLERDLELKDYKIENLTNELKEVRKERDGIDSKLEKFVTLSKELDQMLESQKSGLPEFADNTITDYTRSTPSVNVTNEVRSELGGNNLSMSMINFVKESVCSNVIKISNVENARNIKQCSNDRSNNFGPPIIEDWDSEDESETEVSPIKSIRTNIPTAGLKVPTAKPTVATDKGNKGKAVKASARWIWKPKKISGEGSNVNGISVTIKKYQYIDTQGRLKSDSGCSRHMTGNISYLSDFEPYNGGYVSFGYGGGKITGKGTIKTGKLDVLFTDSECIVLSRDFKLEDDRHVLLRTHRQQNMYAVDLKDIVPHENLTCLIAKASVNESMLWHRRLGHLNFKTMNKLVRNNLVTGLPSKIFENDHSCADCLKGKQHRASCKSKLVNSVTKPLHTFHMDLFGPTSISSLNHKWYCLVVTDDFSRFTWTFFLRTKDEKFRILRNFITEIENLKDLKVKIIRCDNGGEFRNKDMDDFCSRKGIKREFSNARTPQQNGVTERRNRTLIEAARTMVLVTKPHNETPYELFNGRTLAIGFLRPFGCHVMILNTLDHLGKFDAKGDEGFFVGYSLNSKAFRVYNKRTKHIEDNLHINFLESKVIDKAGGLNWLFNIESLTKSMNYIPVVGAGTSSSNISGTKEDAKQAEKEKETSLRFIALPNWFHEVQMITTNDAAKKSGDIHIGSSQKEQEEAHRDKEVSDQVTNEVNVEVPENSGISSTLTVEAVVPTINTHVPTASENVFTIDSTEPPSTPTVDTTVPTTRVEDFFGDTSHVTRLTEVEADLSNMETTIQVSPTPTLRIHKDHPKDQIIGPVDTLVLTRHKSKNVDEQSFMATIHQKADPDLLQLCLFLAFLSQEEPKKISEALKDPSWVKAMQEELLQFQIQNVWVLVDCPTGVRPIGTKWVLKNKKDERGIV
ncbi:putative ribonuclease H-like domain-containing protein [Tanacetum coccineum]|uniref:Ribonuclease H-like domain-containing protein n=1 Tax=Tanacetum coccineum TaxID=301880 RepID=A0ABQ5CLF2_9ASTR